jgi:2-dehydropantoate 2-reductase
MTSGAKPRVAVMGAGGVGSYFGGMLARAGIDITLIGRPAHVEAIRRDGLLLDTTSFRERVRIGASTDPAAVSKAEFVLFCVKVTDTDLALRGLAPHLSPGAIVVSLQNGVDNVERIRAASGVDAVPAVVYIGVALPEPGHVKHFARGELAIGELSEDNRATASPSERCRRVAELFASAKVPCRISDDIKADLWSKFVMNCAGNAVAAIAQTTYGAAAREPHTRQVIARLIEETVAVARASGVRLPQIDFVQNGLKFLESMSNVTSSTAHDVARGKRTEIDSLNGLVLQRGAELGIATPMNFAVYALVKLLEAKNADAASSAAQTGS